VIVAAGLTPAWQQILSFAAFRTGEVNRATETHWIASGKVLNVGCALHHLGVDSRTVSIFGGETVRLMRTEFDRLGVPTRWIETSAPTRVCTTILDERSRQTTELVENSSPISLSELAAFEQAFGDEARSAKWIVLSGSLPRQAPADIYQRLMRSTSANAILDVRGAELEACLPRSPFLVKPNREELAHTFGRRIDTDADLRAAMEELRCRGAQRVVVSQGAGELWFLGDAELLRFRPPKVEPINPIGCGDCLAAGLAVAYSEGADDIAAVKFGMAAAAENARQLLSARLDRDCVEELVSQTREVEARNKFRAK
jgi:1-phosphofructokinase family hexose kinase